MVRAASLPAWAAVIVEAARLLREAGWLSTPIAPAAAQCPAWVCPLLEPAECPACAPTLVCPGVVLQQWSVGLATIATALAVGLVAGLCLGKCHGPPRAAPRRRGGGMVA